MTTTEPGFFLQKDRINAKKTLKLAQIMIRGGQIGEFKTNSIYHDKLHLNARKISVKVLECHSCALLGMEGAFMGKIGAERHSYFQVYYFIF